MGVLFPKELRLGTDTPFRFEGMISDVEVVAGAIPDDLSGLMTQAVPDYQYPPITNCFTPIDAAIGGDGMIRAIRFDGGSAEFITRYVQTERFIAQKAARRGLFGHYRNPCSDDPMASGVGRTTSNTALNFHAGLLLASKEDGLPYAIEPATLRTIGPWTAGGAITSTTLTAHPKFDPNTGEMFSFGYFAKGFDSLDIAYYVVNAAGNVTHQAWLHEPVPCMVHDCAVTENYFLLPVMPYTTDAARVKAGGPFWVYDPSLETLIGLMPRYGSGKKVRWLRAPHSTLSHTVNAFEENGVINFDVLLAPDNIFGMIVPSVSGAVSRGAPGALTSTLARWSIDPNNDSDELPPFKALASVGGDGPHVDDRWHLKHHRYVWLPEILSVPVSAPNASPTTLSISDSTNSNTLGVNPLNAPCFNTISCFDLSAERKMQWNAGQDASLQDPVFCPRPGRTEEGDGYIVVFCNRRNTGGQVIILDALHLDAGPIATLQLPVQLRMGLHSSWTPAHRLIKA